ncbi:YggS family pyridoxal phosphate-dependent enzyme [Halobacteriovorax sp. HLS]|uniref:YggS family pyridoxal phosphate-dependent enzyme n=1 Tax=Halobacteriovorax sp. HLS TaxID=2234000 RepID=UPI000FDB4AC4|nr:YggS family pyridoxal phosphate-dependent enzyme [Halobacteriovorax sp. HLS]
MNRKDLLTARFNELRKNIVGVNSEQKKAQITLVAVTKYSPIEDIQYSYEIGHRAFGENRVLDLQEKADSFAAEGITDIEWHFIGHLQSNKVIRLLKTPGLKYIHSVDSLSLLQNILTKEDQLRSDRVGLFLQVNTSDEDEKYGFPTYDSLAGALNLFLEATDSKFFLAGLMTMGKIRTDNQIDDARKCFIKLKEYRHRLFEDFGVEGLKLSMGMSADYIVAIEEGADFIRVGSTIFSE